MTQNTPTKNIFSHEKATFVIVDDASETQKIDNGLLKIFCQKVFLNYLLNHKSYL